MGGWPSPDPSTAVIVIFGLVYVGMVLGRLPGLALDRTGVALLGAIAMVMVGALPFADAWAAVDMPTIYLLFALMVVSAQFRLAGIYSALVRGVVGLKTSASGLLALVLLVAGGLSALLTNDVVCLAMTPVLVEGCARRKLDPIPFLLGLACASNVGSAATLIGNPQNILIGQTLRLSYSRFLADAGIPALVGLGATWGVIVWQYRGRWEREQAVPAIHAPPFNRWQSLKAVSVSTVLVVLFLFCTDLPREGVALACAGILLLSRRMATREMLSLVDWQLLMLFIGLFMVNDAFARTGAIDAALDAMRNLGLDAREPQWLFGLSVALSNLVSNVPATMLLLPAATHPLAGPILALSSTLAGNLFIVGSIANIIVVTSAKPLGVDIGFRTHAQTGVPVTLVTLMLAVGWLWLRSLGQ
jgi:Na+/H+ antiporter NhaD/arsenite permease-like protein